MAYNRPIQSSKKKGAVSGGIDALMKAETAMQIALVLPCSVCVGWLLGAWADRAWHQSWVSIAGIVLGCVSGLVYVIRIALSAIEGPPSGGGGRGSGNGDARPLL